MNERFNAVVGANISKFRKKMAEVNKIARKTASDIVKNIKADDSQFKKKMAGIKKKLAALPEKVWIDLKVRAKNYQNAVGAIANVSRSIGELGQMTGRGSLIAISPAIVPILASIVGLIGSLGPMVGVLGASTFALATAFGFAGAAAVAFGAAAVPALTKIFDGSELVTKSQKEARKAFEGFKSTWQDITKSVEKPILEATAKAFTAFNKILEMSRPLFQGAADAVNRLMASFNQSLNTEPVKAFFDYLNKQGGPLLETLGKSAGNFLQGLMSMMTAFGPLAETTAQGFLNMSKGFAEWAAGLSKSEKFQSFISYVQENMPKLKSIFSDAMVGIVAFFTAFGPMSADMMTSLQGLMGKFKEWATSLSENTAFQTFLGYIQENGPKVLTLIGNLWDLIVNLGIALAPVGSVILDLVNNFISWSNSMMENHPWIGKIGTALLVMSGIFLAIIPNLLAVAAFFELKAVAAFAKFIAKVVVSTATFVFNTAIMIARWVLLGTQAMLHGAKVAAAWLLTTGVNMIVAVASMIANTAIMIAKWVLMGAQALLHGAKVGAAWLLTTGAGMVTAVASMIATSAVFVAKWVWMGVQAMIQAARMAAAWFIAMGPIGWVIAAIIGLAILIIANWDKISSWTKKAWTKVWDFIKSAWEKIKTGTIEAASKIWTTVKDKFQQIVDSVKEKMNNVKSKIEEGWNKAKAFLEGIDLFQIGVNIIQGLINGIGSMVGAVASKISEVAGGIKDKITGALGIHSPSRYMKWVGKMAGTGLVKGISGMVKPVSNMANKMAQASMIQPQRSAIGFESSGFGELRKSISVSNDSNKEKVEAEKVQGDTIIRLEIDSEVLGAAVVPHVDDSQSREIRTRMAVMGVL